MGYALNELAISDKQLFRITLHNTNMGDIVRDSTSAIGHFTIEATSLHRPVILV